MSTDSPEVLHRDDHPGVRVLTLDRPEALNAFDRSLFEALSEALASAAEDPGVGCVVLTGAGRAFTAGSDLAGDDDGDGGGEDPYERLMGTIEGFSKPLIAAVNGLAIGIGTTLLGHCDLVLAADSARFRVPFTSLGLVPEAGSTATLPAMMGRQAAAHALFSSGWISAEEARESGLVWRLRPAEELLPEAVAVAAEIAAQPLESLVATKRLLLAERLPGARAAREREDPEFRRLFEGAAFAEATAAFREKRKPRFAELGVAAR
jgi:enoyl-CoA hydratase/carnithine racemase